MTSTSAVSAAAPARKARQRGIARFALGILGALASLSAATNAAHAQTTVEQKPRWEILVTNGRLVPTGTQRDAIQRGKLTAAQLSYVARPALAITATVGWARSRDNAAIGEPKLDVFTYDVGAEFRSPKLFISKAVSLKPFAGAGAGARSYHYRSLDVDATHNLAAYGSAGGELGIRRVRLRLEARDYMSGFKPLNGEGTADTRNDVVVMAGLRIAAR